ncbi:hypothetical protein ONE63_009147 [Megalurothrips usitatus]|uniref:Uncharacterized protein n=1 Tax=Megalurothrips usitatus TaxID=439358 RepID=A0AAV7XM49_9NEOP|nr:hypothetical protein ONE63_009147 [Megalurothrips usitatus]
MEDQNKAADGAQEAPELPAQDDVKATTQVTVTSPTLPHITTAEAPEDGADSKAEADGDGDPRQRKSSTSSTSSLGGAWGGTSWWEERSRSVTPSGVHCLDVPPTGGWAARRWSGGESPSPRGALSPLLELRRPHCTLNCSTCNTILEEKYKNVRSRRASFVKEAGKWGRDEATRGLAAGRRGPRRGLRHWTAPVRCHVGPDTGGDAGRHGRPAPLCRCHGRTRVSHVARTHIHVRQRPSRSCVRDLPAARRPARHGPLPSHLTHTHTHTHTPV